MSLSDTANAPSGRRGSLSSGVPADTSKRAAVHAAIDAGTVEILEALLRGGADPNARFASDVTPLKIACTKANAAMARVLLQYGAKLGDGDEVRTFLTAGSAIRHCSRSLPMSVPATVLTGSTEAARFMAALVQIVLVLLPPRHSPRRTHLYNPLPSLYVTSYAPVPTGGFVADASARRRAAKRDVGQDTSGCRLRP